MKTISTQSAHAAVATKTNALEASPPYFSSRTTGLTRQSVWRNVVLADLV
jgi:hypothetical protein